MSLVEFLRSQLDNDVATGAVTAVAFGAVLAALRKVPSALYHGLKRRFVVEIDIADHDPAFFWLESWLAQHPYAKRAKLLSASTRTAPGRSHDDSSQHEIRFSPAPGPHLMWHQGRPVLLYRYRWKPDGGFSDLMYRDQFTLYALGRSVITSIIDEAAAQANPSRSEMLSVYRSHHERWLLGSKRSARPVDSVVLDGRIGEELVDDLRRFIASRERYERLGIPYQRGYLLYGPPGSGKTSIAAALAGAVGRDLYVVRPTSVTDAGFDVLMSNVPGDGIVLIEDVDCVFDGRTRVESGGFQPLTFSGFINAIDGVAAPSGRVLILTTNHRDKLDPALIRAGRVDVQRELGAATKSQAERMYLRFYPGDHAGALAFGADVERSEDAVSMASLQECLVAGSRRYP